MLGCHKAREPNLSPITIRSLALGNLYPACSFRAAAFIILSWHAASSHYLRCKGISNQPFTTLPRAFIAFIQSHSSPLAQPEPLSNPPPAQPSCRCPPARSLQTPTLRPQNFFRSPNLRLKQLRLVTTKIYPLHPFCRAVHAAPPLSLPEKTRLAETLPAVHSQLSQTTSQTPHTTPHTLVPSPPRLSYPLPSLPTLLPLPPPSPQISPSLPLGRDVQRWAEIVQLKGEVEASMAGMAAPHPFCLATRITPTLPSLPTPHPTSLPTPHPNTPPDRPKSSSCRRTWRPSLLR